MNTDLAGLVSGHRQEKKGIILYFLLSRWSAPQITANDINNIGLPPKSEVRHNQIRPSSCDFDELSGRGAVGQRRDRLFAAAQNGRLRLRA